MAFKFVAFAAVLACAQAGLIGSPYGAAPVSYSAPVAYAAPAKVAYAAPVAKVAYAAPVAKVAYAAPVAKAVVAEEYDPHPQYSYGYEVQDGLTGDNKSQHESRDGDVVHGSYSLIDADGYKRTVEYTADPVHGFNAVVHREPLAVKAVAKVAAPVAYAAPVAKYVAPVAKVAAPLSYAAPAASYYHH